METSELARIIKQPRYGLEEHLDALAKRSLAAQVLSSIWCLDKKCLGLQLQVTSRMFQPYSDHSAMHSQAIVDAINLMLGESRVCLLSATDTWALLECAWRHDTGMQVSNDEVRTHIASSAFRALIKELTDSPDGDMRYAADQLMHMDIHYEDPVLSALDLIDHDHSLSLILSYHYRKNHAERSMKNMNEAEDLMRGFGVQPRIWQQMAAICKGHALDRKDIIRELRQVEDGVDNDYMHPRFIQILLRLGDLLDLDNNRFNMRQLEEWGKLPEASLHHFLKHKQIAHLYISPERIELVAKFQPNTEAPRDDGLLFDKYEAIYKKKAIDYAEKMRGMKPSELIASMDQFYAEFGDSRVFEKYRDREGEYRRSAKRQHNACMICADWFTWLSEELDFFAKKWASIAPKDFPGSVPVLSPDEMQIWWQSNPLDFDTINLKYRVDHKRAAQIIQGSGLYGAPVLENIPPYIGAEDMRELTFIRELVQNAMDATKIQVFRYLREGRYGEALRKFGNNPREWDPITVMRAIGNFVDYLVVEVHIHYHPDIARFDTEVNNKEECVYQQQASKKDALTIEVVDVGTGIDSDTLRDMSRIGNTRDKQLEKEIEMMPQWIKPNGAFGIGMQSVFGVTDEFRAVSGSRRDHKLRDIFFENINNGGSLFAAERPQEQTSNTAYGTRIKVHLKNDELNRLNIFSRNGTNPFERDCAAMFDVLKEQINRMLGRDIFHINVRYFIDDVEWLPKETSVDEGTGCCRDKQPYATYPSLLSPFLTEGLNAEGFRIDNAYGPLVICKCQNDTDSCVIVRMTLRGINKDAQMAEQGTLSSFLRPIRFFYRGMQVMTVEYNRQMLYPCWDVEAYVYCDRPEKMLTINRNQLLPDRVDEMFHLVTNAADAALNDFFSYIFCGDHEVDTRLHWDHLTDGEKNAFVYSWLFTQLIWKINPPLGIGVGEKSRNIMKKIAKETSVQIPVYRWGLASAQYTTHNMTSELLDSNAFDKLRFIHPNDMQYTLNRLEWVEMPHYESYPAFIVQDIFTKYLSSRKLTYCVTDIRGFWVKEENEYKWLALTYQYGKYNRNAILSPELEDAILLDLIEKLKDINMELNNTGSGDWRNRDALIDIPPIGEIADFALFTREAKDPPNTNEPLTPMCILPFTWALLANRLNEWKEAHENMQPSSSDMIAWDISQAAREAIRAFQKEPYFDALIARVVRDIRKRHPDIKNEQRIKDQYLAACEALLKRIWKLMRVEKS